MFIIFFDPGSLASRDLFFFPVTTRRHRLKLRTLGEDKARNGHLWKTSTKLLRMSMGKCAVGAKDTIYKI